MAAKKPNHAQLELLQKVQPSYWRTKTERKRFFKELKDDKVLQSLAMNGWIEPEGDQWVPTEAGYLALMLATADYSPAPIHRQTGSS